MILQIQEDRKKIEQDNQALHDQVLTMAEVMKRGGPKKSVVRKR